MSAKHPKDMELAERIRIERASRRWTQGELANRLRDVGLTNFYPNTVSRIERGERAVSVGELFLIAEAFGISAEFLIGFYAASNVLDVHVVRKAQLDKVRDDLAQIAQWIDEVSE